MEHNLAHKGLSLGGYLPYQTFSAELWAGFRGAAFVPLTSDEIEAVRSIGDPIDLKEVERIYLSLVKLLAINIENFEALGKKQCEFFHGSLPAKQPFIIGIAGSVAVGKSTMARMLKILLQRLQPRFTVSLVTTDGFLYPNAVLAARNKMQRKGFPDSYDTAALLKFLAKIKAGERNVAAPLYSHFTYDVLPDQKAIIDRPDILIVEGINVLQVYDLAENKPIKPFVSDFFDFSIYIDAKIANIEQWYIKRFMQLRATSFNKEGAYFQKYVNISEEEARAKAKAIWKEINLKNLRENIAPTKTRAKLILCKGDNHLVEEVKLRKI
ncbi:type I pantothenate kinase [Bartonella sp. TP]|uniref:type I pantothenate kinase n=1 Tax=Bartonella sp. TP TaxID=3057550 RepID=UPI0025B04521|nr:type I pantothenate kinase [Bartonella sp. TP]WJW80409.1 type I pantothenate kinase [Bartonella sp. TP]